MKVGQGISWQDTRLELFRLVSIRCAAGKYKGTLVRYDAKGIGDAYITKVLVLIVSSFSSHERESWLFKECDLFRMNCSAAREPMHTSPYTKLFDHVSSEDRCRTGKTNVTALGRLAIVASHSHV